MMSRHLGLEKRMSLVHEVGVVGVGRAEGDGEMRSERAAGARSQSTQ